MADKKAHNENFFTLKVKLFTDFSTLSNVQVVVDNQKLELDALSVGEVEAENKKQI
jgi:hypothetical protein